MGENDQETSNEEVNGGKELSDHQVGDIEPAPDPERKTKGKGRKPNITLEDVRNIAFDDDGKPINPFKLTLPMAREKLGGRGSYTTLTKHIRTLRDEAERLIQDPKIDTPPVPYDVSAVLWKAAWDAAKETFMKQCADLSARNDMLRDQNEAIAGDVNPIIEELSICETEIEKKNKIIESLQVQMQQAHEKHTQEVSGVHGKLNESRTQIKVLTDLIEKNIKPYPSDT